MNIKKFLKLYILLLGIALICNSLAAMVQTVYTIQGVGPGPVKDSFWVPVDGDKVLVRVNQVGTVPQIQEVDGKYKPNFVYFDPSTEHNLTEAQYKGLFCFKSDETVGKTIIGEVKKPTGEIIGRQTIAAAVLRPFDKKFSYAWSTVKTPTYNSYHKKGTAPWDWGNQLYAPAADIDPNPFTFTVKKDIAGADLFIKINKDSTAEISNVVSTGAAAGVGAAAGAAAGGAGVYAKCPQDQANHLLRSQIFEYLFGKSETKFFDENNPSNFANAFVKKGDEYFIKNSTTKKEFRCGKIDLRKFGTLNGELKSKETALKPKNPQPSFNVIFYEMSNPAFQGIRKFREFADVGAMQGRVENNDAVFQLASRPNGLEGGREYRGHGFTDITQAFAVQGEEAAISAAPGGIFRMFGDVPYPYFSDGQNWGMNFFKYIEIEKGEKKVFLGDKITKDGNVDFDVALLNKINGSDEWWNGLLICFHENIQVSTGLSCVHRKGDDRSNNANDCNALIPKDRAQIIHQVAVSALDLAHGAAKGKNFQDNPFVAIFSQNLLKYCYCGTIIASILHGKNKIFLTAVGAGAFKNKPEWVVEAIEACKDLIKTFGLNVYVVFMGSSTSGETDLPDEYKNILGLVKEIGGNYLKIRFNSTDNTEKAILTHYDGDKIGNKTFQTTDACEHVFSEFLTNPKADLINMPEYKIYGFEKHVFDESYRGTVKLAGKDIAVEIDPKTSNNICGFFKNFAANFEYLDGSGNPVQEDDIYHANYLSNKFTFTVLKDGKYYSLNLEGDKPVLTLIERPMVEPEQSVAVVSKLGQLKNNLAALKGKLGALSGKLGELKEKLGGK